MKKDTPRLDTTIAFLKSKGWTMAPSVSRYQVLVPPSWMKFSEPMQYYLPFSEKPLDYDRWMKNVALSISELYELDYKQLLNLLSRSFEELEKEEPFRQAILAHAS